MGEPRERRQIAVTALLLAEGYEPDEITLRSMVDRAVRDLVSAEVEFELEAKNLNQPDAEKYGTHPDSSPMYAPEWYVAHGISTGIHERLYGTLSDLLSCEVRDVKGRKCSGSILHPMIWGHWDGNGNHWGDDGAAVVVEGEK